MSEEKKNTRSQICIPVPKNFKDNIDTQMRKKAYEEDRKITYLIILQEALNEYFGVDLMEEEKPKKKRRKKDDE